MSILGKHPAPWCRGDSDDGTWFSVVAANGSIVSDDFNCDQEAEVLILAAPELLAALKELADQLVVFNGQSEKLDRANELIARIEPRPKMTVELRCAGCGHLAGAHVVEKCLVDGCGCRAEPPRIEGK